MPEPTDSGDTLLSSHPGEPAPPAPPVQRIGRYVVLSEVGSGAMGRVYAAYDPELDRKVAVKTLNLSSWHVSSTSGRARLVREAQAMAKLSHPNVVPVYDAGTFEQGVFLAMELVEGRTLADWIREGRHPWRETVALFVDAGRGLAAAHAAGIIHRDFKPANVLVGKDGRARVTDFGLARAESLDEPPATDPPEGDTLSGPILATPLTVAGSMMGTPGYMSPEQYLGQDVSALTDQFAFCASLFEALYGVRPFEGDTLIVLAEKARTGDIRRPPDVRVPARLDTIAVRGLSPSPRDRYPSMDALVAELSLDPSAAARRYGAFALAALLLVGAGVGVRATSRHQSQLCRGGPAKLAGVWDDGTKAQVRAAFLATGVPYAERSWDVVRERLDGYTKTWVGAFGDACEAAQVRGEQSQRVMDLRMGCLEERRAELVSLTGLLGKADTKAVENAVSAAFALASLSRCSDVEALSQPVPLPQDPGARAAIADLERKLAEARSLFDLGRYADTLASLKTLVAPAQAAHYPPLAAQVLGQKARTESATDSPAAAASYQASFAAAQAGQRDDLAARDLVELAQVVGGSTQGKSEEARMLLVLAQGAMGRFHPDVALQADWHRAAGQIAGGEGRVDEAIAEHEQALALREKLGEPLGISEALFSLGWEQANKGDLTTSRATFHRAMDLREGVLGSEHPKIIESLNELARSEHERGNFDEALAYLSRARALTERTFGPASVRMCKLHNNIANTLEAADRGPEAVAEAKAALEVCAKALPKDSPSLPVVRMVFGMALRADGRPAEAVVEHKGAIADLERLHTLQPPFYCMALNDLGRDYLVLHKPELALKQGDASYACFQKGEPQGLRASEALQTQGRALLGLGRLTEAAAPLEKALDINLKSKADPVDEADIQFPLAQVVWSTDKARSRELARTAQAAYQNRKRVKAAREVAAWREKHP